MKETKTINMFGILYTVDADAYDLLDRYLNEMKAYYSGRKGCGEIASDIECRIAELMEEYRTTGVQSITIDNVREIISRIGRPEDFGDTGDAAEFVETDTLNYAGSQKVDKKLFRDTDHKMLGGVLAGLGCYWDVNPLWFRLLVALLAFASFGVVTVLYIVAWACIPPAVTPADRLQMRGESVNVENLTEQIMKDGQVNADSQTCGAEKGISAVLNVICMILKGGFFLAGAAFVLWCVIMLIITIVGGVMILFTPAGIEAEEIGMNGLNRFQMAFGTCSPALLLTTFLSIIATLSLTIFMVVHFILRLAGRVTPLSGKMKITCLIVWFISLVFMLSSGFRTLLEFQQESRRLRSIRYEQYKLNSDQRAEEFLRQRGWQIVKRDGTENVLSSGRHYSGDGNVKYLNGYSPYGTLKFEAIKQEKVVPGKYRLTAYGRTDGDGVEIFAKASGQRFATKVPADGDRGGSVWQEARDAFKADTVSDRRRRPDRRARVNRNRGYGWNKLTVEGISVGPDSMIVYGVTNETPSGYWNGKWLSACEFKLEKID